MSITVGGVLKGAAKIIGVTVAAAAVVTAAAFGLEAFETTANDVSGWIVDKATEGWKALESFFSNSANATTVGVATGAAAVTGGVGYWTGKSGGVNKGRKEGFAKAIQLEDAGFDPRQFSV